MPGRATSLGQRARTWKRESSEAASYPVPAEERTHHILHTDPTLRSKKHDWGNAKGCELMNICKNGGEADLEVEDRYMR